MRYPLNSKYFKYFKGRCEYWKHLLGIQYSVKYKWSNQKGIEAAVWYDTASHTAVIYLAKSWNGRPTYEDMDIAALHEVCHLLLAKIFEMGEQYYAKPYLLEIEHGIITGLEKIIGRK